MKRGAKKERQAAPGAPDAADERVSGWLAAGGFLPVDLPVPAKEPVDLVSARTYTHRALGERPVVRLVGDRVAAGEDTELLVLGFEAPSVRAKVARRRRRALGFPGWALVNDPQRAKLALEVVQDLRREARRAKSKPGHAKTAFDELAKRLGRSVPHFLPSYYEEVGRAFVEAGNPGLAAQAFARAREAEKVHALEVDEDARREAFLEFALAGAVTVKALSEYAKELEQSAGTRDAWRHFRELALRRTLGGMPPWSGMGRDLRRLAKAAGLDVAAEEEAWLEEVLGSPSLARAPREFWAEHEASLVRLCGRFPAARGALLRLHPQVPGDWEGTFLATWLELLEQTGATAGLCEPEAAVPAEARPPGNPARWLSEVLGRTGGYRSAGVPDPAFGLLRRMAKRLAADGEAVSLAGRWGHVDADLADLALELAVPVADPPDNGQLDLTGWAERAGSGPEHGRDLGRLAAEPRYERLLEHAIGELAGSPEFEAAATGKAGLATARRAWLLGIARRVGEEALPGARDALRRLAPSDLAGAFREFPEAYEVLKASRIAPVLARSLVGGQFFELGWPALEAAWQELAPQGPAKRKGKDLIWLAGAFPYLIVATPVRAVVLGQAGRVLEHDLRLPKGAELRDLRYAQGALLVLYSERWEGKAYWSHRPGQVFSVQLAWGSPSPGHVGIELPDGGITEGARALHAGDTDIPGRFILYADGASFWQRWEYLDELVELEPATGKLGRKSLPRFLEEFADPGCRLDVRSSWLYPVPALSGDSPLGAKDGLAGWRVRSRIGGGPGAEVVGEGLDGRRYEGPALARHVPVGLLSMPGARDPRPVTAPGECSLWDSATGQEVARQKLALPLPFWHYFHPYDEAGSAALRSLSDELASKLLEAALGETPAGASSDEEEDEEEEDAAKVTPLPAVEKALRKALPQVTHPFLVAGVVGAVEEAARLARRLERCLSRFDPEARPQAPARRAGPQVDDQAAARALGDLLIGSYYGVHGLLGAEVEAVSAFFAGPTAAEERQRVGTESNFPWEAMVGRAGALAFKAASPATSPDARTTLVWLLELWAETLFADHADRMRECTARFTDEKGVRAEPTRLLSQGGSRYVRKPLGYGVHEGPTHRVLEHSPTGEFQLPAGATLVEERRCAGGWGSSDAIRRFLALLAERGPVPWDPEAVRALSERTGLTPAEAALLWAGLPGVNAYGKNFLSKEVRELLRVKVAEADAARKVFQATDSARRLALYDAAMPPDPEALWTPLGTGPADETSPVARLAAAWNATMGRRASIPADLATAAARELEHSPLDPTAFLQALADPAGSAPANRDGVWEIRPDRHGWGCQVVEQSGAGDVFAGDFLRAVALYVPWLFERLPVGDAFRSALPDLCRRVRERLARPGLLLDAATLAYDKEEPARALLESVGGEPFAPPGERRLEGRDSGSLLAALNVAGHGYSTVHLFFRPERVKDYERLVVPGLAPPLLAAQKHSRIVSPLAAARFVASPGCAALIARIEKTPVPAGGFEANPGLAVPRTVKAAMKAHSLSEDAAVLYLQTLALARLAEKEVQRTNGWPPARYKQAAAELVERKLLLSAKRERAGRSVFLPGGWEPLPSPHPPIESWKASLYGLSRADDGRLAAPLGALLTLRPLHELFEEAWRRVAEGDVPRYEETK